MAILEWRERVARVPVVNVAKYRASEDRMKQDIKARLFGLAVTLAFFGVAFLPDYGSRW